MVWCVCVIPPLWRGPPTPVAPRASVEGLEQQGPLRAGEVRADEVALEAAEPLAQPVEVALVGDREQDRGAGNGLISDGLELLLGDADALEMLVERPGSGTDRDRPEHGDEEEGPDQEPPERPPAGALPPFASSEHHQGSRATTTCSSTSRGSDPESRTAEWNRRTSNPSP